LGKTIPYKYGTYGRPFSFHEDLVIKKEQILNLE